MTHITRSATFGADDAPGSIVDDLACPACGRWEPREVNKCLAGNQMRLFCEGCGAFITIRLTDEQAEAIRRHSTLLSSVA